MKIILCLFLSFSILVDFTSANLAEVVESSQEHVSSENTSDCDSHNEEHEHSDNSHCHGSCHVGHFHTAVFNSAYEKVKYTCDLCKKKLHIHILSFSEEYTLKILRPPILRS